MKLRHISAVVALAVLLPFAAGALSVDELTAQIQNLLSQVAQLQQQLKQLETVKPVNMMPLRTCPDGTSVATYLPCPTSPSRVCPQILRQLSQGTTGSDVTSLQQYLGVSQTGYFGPMTAQAVAKFQANEGLSQVGSVGPQTRAAFARKCGVGNSQNFSASPTSGAAPLTVTFKTNLRIPAEFESGAPDTFYYRTYFGDGQSGEIDSRGLSHTYASAGTYMATLMRIFSCGSPAPGLECNPRPQETVGTVTITVGGSDGSPAISVSETPSSVRQGAVLTASWDAQNMPTDSSVGIFLYDDKGQDYGLITLRAEGATGSRSWTVPGSNCDSQGSCFFMSDNSQVWYTKPGTYRLVGKMYTPAHACFGYCAGPQPTILTTGYSSWFTITQ
ncbi:MAG: peptidoglycan-binding protein [bacterium]|nr:peptidoglycan-binding protein [bacterium]